MNKKKIFIIDDDPDFVSATRTILEDSSYECAWAYSCEEALEKVKEVNPDLIILDVMMKREDSGFEMCRVLKKEVETKKIPILMLTCVDSKYKLHFSSAAGDETWLPVEDFIDKPVKAGVLVERVKKLLRY